MKATDDMNRAWWALRVFFGAVPIVAGLDKYLNILTNWSAYLNPAVTRVLPLSPTTLLHIVGVIEIAAGVIVLSRWTRLGAYVVMFWLLGIAGNLAMMGKYYDVAVRDIGLAIAAFTLAQLAAKREAEMPERELALTAQRANI
jgi:uncharacterized membrane protein YphA (DoxX/SURF4 family)